MKVAGFDKETLSKLDEGIVPIMITYTSNKPEAVTVKQNGRLIAKESGVAIITATVTMQDGTKEVYTRKISVSIAKEEILKHLTPKRTGSLFIGGKSANLGWFGLKLSENVVKVSNFDEETLSKIREGIVPIKITYVSNNPDIVAVKQNGRLIAKESGVAIITATVTMQDGTKEVYTRKLTVKKATVDIVEKTARMKV